MASELKTTAEQRAAARAQSSGIPGFGSTVAAHMADDIDTLLAEVKRLREGLFPIATGRFASVAEACDLAEAALGADAVAQWNAAENARAALETK